MYYTKILKITSGGDGIFNGIRYDKYRIFTGNLIPYNRDLPCPSLIANYTAGPTA